MSDFTLGKHDAAIHALVSDMAQVRADVSEIKEALAERRGERRVTLWLGGAAGGVAGYAIPVLLKLIGITPGNP